LSTPRARLGLIAAAVAGLGVLAYLVFYVGVGAVFAAVSKVGWGGFALICVIGLALFAILGGAWFTVVPASSRPRFTTFIWGRAVRDSAAEVLPFSQVGGFVIGARAVTLRGVSAAMASASTIVDVTTEMMAQIAYVLVGVAILIARVPKSQSSDRLANIAMIATVVGVLGAIGFVVVQKRGFAHVERLASRFLPKAAAQAGALQGAMESIHAAPLRIFLSVCIHLLGWFASAFAAYVIVRLMGVHVAYVSMVAIEALLCAIRSAAIIVPNALGVQEAAYAMLMPLFGLSAPVGIALSLLRRARDIAMGIPILLVWQAAEGGRMMRKEQPADAHIGNGTTP
jgi:putative membrane protein